MSNEDVMNEMKIINEKATRLVNSIDQPMSKKEAAEYLGMTEKELVKHMTRSRNPLPYRSRRSGTMYLLKSDIIKWIKL